MAPRSWNEHPLMTEGREILPDIISERNRRMGLDSYFKLKGKKTKEDENDHPVFTPSIKLCGGLFSGPVEGRCPSFRGKAYDALVERITGESLYQQSISNAKLKKMATKLEQGEFSDSDLGDYLQEEDKDCLLELRRLFRTYADLGATLHGWW